jgi:hypothetical protein
MLIDCLSRSVAASRDVANRTIELGEGVYRPNHRLNTLNGRIAPFAAISFSLSFKSLILLNLSYMTPPKELSMHDKGMFIV